MAFISFVLERWRAREYFSCVVYLVLPPVFLRQTNVLSIMWLVSQVFHSVCRPIAMILVFSLMSRWQYATSIFRLSLGIRTTMVIRIASLQPSLMATLLSWVTPTSDHKLTIDLYIFILYKVYLKSIYLNWVCIVALSPNSHCIFSTKSAGWSQLPVSSCCVVLSYFHPTYCHLHNGYRYLNHCFGNIGYQHIAY